MPAKLDAIISLPVLQPQHAIALQKCKVRTTASIRPYGLTAGCSAMSLHPVLCPTRADRAGQAPVSEEALLAAGAQLAPVGQPAQG